MEDQKLTGTLRKNIFEGALVEIIQKHHQRTGELTEGLVVKLLTKSPQHPHGIKVQLDTGEVGRVKWVLIEDID
ncbi:MAG: putative repeat protein (TIGR03833 family) [Salibacteraceae bacterium]|jgi:uncharacterized repeat protein (TIGR03833 family)